MDDGERNERFPEVRGRDGRERGGGDHDDGWHDKMEKVEVTDSQEKDQVLQHSFLNGFACLNEALLHVDVGQHDEQNRQGGEEDAV